MPKLLPRSNVERRPAADEFETALRRHVIDVWFPRCVDVEHGGFLCDFDRTWRPCGAHDKLLEFQARQTWLAAEALQFAPNDQRLRHAAVHGFRFLRDVLWDREGGGWFHHTDRGGTPLEAYTKHVHGMAYAIAACVAVHTATGEAGALPLAREAFTWLEQHAHDRRHSGYFGFLRRDGAVIRDTAHCPWPAVTDTIGTHIGLKDANVHCDLLLAFTYLYRARPDPAVAERLHEIVRILCDKMLVPTGALFFLCLPDWTPVPHVMRYGYGFQMADRLLAARDLIGMEEKMIAVARRVVDFLLRDAWDTPAGGFFYAGPASFPAHVEGSDLIVRRKAWWVQCEALRALLTLSRSVPDNETYLRYFAAQWHYLQSSMIDARHGGIYPIGLDSLPRWRRRLGAGFAPATFTRKGSVWKDGWHDGRAWLYCRSALRANTQGRGTSKA